MSLVDDDKIDEGGGGVAKNLDVVSFGSHVMSNTSHFIKVIRDRTGLGFEYR